MTKEELMKYANDPFWVKLRWFMFVLFWALWVAMLVGAILIIVHSPKCAAPTELTWWKKGPLITITGEEKETEIEEIKSFKAQGVIYELKDTDTYAVETKSVEDKIRKLVETYEAHNIHLVLDLTPNYVSQDDELFKSATQQVPDPEALSAFIVSENTNNWKKVHGNQSAWKQVGKNNFLSQFGENYDLRMDSEVAQNKLNEVIRHLASLGVKGFRLNNARYFIVNPDMKDETHNPIDHKHMMDEYEFYTHGQTIFQDGLGDLMRNFSRTVQNATNGEGFLSINDDLSARAEVFTISNTTQLSFDLPRFGFINAHLKGDTSDKIRKLYNAFKNLKNVVDIDNLWMQLPYSHDSFRSSEHQNRLDASAYNMFVMLLPGTPIVSLNAINYGENKTETVKKLEEIRESKAFQHGKFDFFLSVNETAFAYTR